MSVMHRTAADAAPVYLYTGDEMEGVYVLLAEALSDIAADVPSSAADHIERAMVRLAIA